MDSLQPCCLTPGFRLQEIFGKDTTYDFDYINSLKSGPVEDAGYEGLPQVDVEFICLKADKQFFSDLPELADQRRPPY